MNTQQAITRGVHHAGLTVPDLAATRDFFLEGLGFQQVGEIPDYPAVFLSDGVIMITLWQASNPASAVPFDRHHNIGLHHLAFLVDDLEAVHQRLSTRDNVRVEFHPEPLLGGPTRHMMCHIPGGIRVEFIAPASA